MWWFILCVAVLNMAGGFGLAVVLAGQYTIHNGFDQGDDAVDSMIPESMVASESVGPENLAAASSVETDSEGPGEEVVPLSRSQSAAKEEENGAGSRDLREAGDSSDNPTMADLDAAVLAALCEGTLVESADTAPTPMHGKVAKSEDNRALRAFQTQLGSFCQELIALDEQLRRQPPKEVVELTTHLEAFAESNRKQDETCKDVEDSLRAMITAEVIDTERGEAMIAAVQEERREAAESFTSFGDLEGEADAATQCEMVLDRTASLLGANYGLRDSMSDMISSTESQGAEDGSRSKVDPLTEVLSRAGLDAMLAEYWERDPQHVRPLSFTVIDLDAFAKLNRKYGAALGDRALRAIAQLLRSESPPDCHVGRFAGQRFALLAIDRELKQAVGDAEHLRQTIEKVRFEYGANDLKITVSCGVVAVIPSDTQKSLYSRAVESVQEAKRYGRNRCVVYEGEFPTPVVPPNLALSEKHVTV